MTRIIWNGFNGEQCRQECNGHDARRVFMDPEKRSILRHNFPGAPLGFRGINCNVQTFSDEAPMWSSAPKRGYLSPSIDGRLFSLSPQFYTLQSVTALLVLGAPAVARGSTAISGTG